MHHSSSSRSDNFQCPNCHVDIHLPDRYLQKCSWNRNSRLKDDLRHLTEKWSLIKRKVDQIDSMRHIHAISDYLEDVIDLFQNSILGRHIILEDACTNTDGWSAADVQFSQTAPNEIISNNSTQPDLVSRSHLSNPASQQFTSHQIQQVQQQQTDQMPQVQQQQTDQMHSVQPALQWNQQQWQPEQSVSQFPVNESYSNVPMNQMSRYEAFQFYNQDFQANSFQNQGFYGNYQTTSSTTFNDNFAKRKAPRPPKELIQIKTAPFDAKTCVPLATENKKPSPTKAGNKQNSQRQRRKSSRKTIPLVNESK